MAQPDPSRWSDHLPLVMLSLSSTLKADIGCTAADLVYGTSLRLPDVVIDHNGKTDTVSIDRVKPVYIDDSDHSSPQHCTPPQTVRPPPPTGDSPSPVRRTRSGSHVHWPDSCGEHRLLLTNARALACQCSRRRPGCTPDRGPGSAMHIIHMDASSSSRQGYVCNLTEDHLLTRRLEDQQTLDKNASVVTRWCQLRVVVHAIALDVLGRARRQHPSWFNENDAAISSQLAEENKLDRAYIDRASDANKAAFYQSRRLAQQWLQEIQDTWLARKAKEIRGSADRNETKDFFAAIEALYDQQNAGAALLLNTDGSTLLTKKS
ncbi:hypothetical protein SprV_0502032300 [Sparganum proliferum]